MKPQRIQRKRAKGWNMQKASPNGLPVVYVGRPTKWGNPFMAASSPMRAGRTEVIVESPEEAVRCFRGLLHELWGTDTAGIEAIRCQLGGKNLACRCPLVDKDGNRVPCHADVLLEIANP